MVVLRRTPAPAAAPVVLDPSQRRVLESRAPVVRVLGAPGTGKTTVATELVADAVGRGARADECLLLTATRQAAARLREQVTMRVGGTTTQPLARTWQAFGFAVLRAEAALRGEPPPRLLNGPEQDVILRDLLAGHAAGDAPAPPWPESVHPALDTRGFRNELRDLLMRAVEHGQGPEDLERLGLAAGRPEWVAAAHVLGEYDAVTALSRHGAYDPAWVLTATADRLEADPQALARLQERLALVVVDDAQELTSAAARLLGVLAPGGPRIVLVGDPDSAVQTFRGADPRFLAQGWEALAPEERREALVLTTSHRLRGRLVGVASRVCRRIGVLAGVRHRLGDPQSEITDECNVPPVEPDVRVALLRSVAQEASHIASVLRRAHLLEGMSWDDMAVIVRGSARADAVRRHLGHAGVPITAGATEVPVRDEPAVRPLLALLDEATAIARAEHRGEAHVTEPVRAADLVLSPLGGTDAVGLRRLRRLLRRDELAAGGSRSSDDLLSALLREPARAALLGTSAQPAARVGAALAAGVAAARLTPDGRWAPGVTPESVLWAIWQASGLAEPWRRVALAGGPAGQRADRDLDAVLVLFDAAAAFVDRLPSAGPDTFLEHLLGQDVPADTLLVGAQSGPHVELLTPQSAAGRQWRLVVVAGAQEGVWPDLRLRGSLLGSEDLVDELAGRPTGFRAAQAAVRYDETRLFHVAVTRCTERLLVTAVGNEDDQPSVYLDLVDPPAGHGLDDELRPHTEVERTMSLAGLVGELRRDLASPEPSVAARAGRLLAAAAHHGVRGAHPESWWALREVSSTTPLRDPSESVTVSPSKVQYFAECGLRWFLTSVGGEGVGFESATVGTFVHDIVAELPEASLAALCAAVDARWGRLGLRPGWVTERTRREAHDMVARFVRYREAAREHGWTVAAIESDFRVEVGRAVVRGRVDRIERDQHGALRIIDLKTGSTKPVQADLLRHGQLGAYQVAIEEGGFAELGDVSAGAALVFVGKAGHKGQRPAVLEQAPLQDSDDPDWARDLIRSTADGMAAAEFAATEGGCRTCQVRSSCPVQPEGDAL